MKSWFSKVARVLGVCAVAWFAGYCTACLQRRKRIVDPEVVAFIRREQLNRIRGMFFSIPPSPCRVSEAP